MSEYEGWNANEMAHGQSTFMSDRLPNKVPKYITNTMLKMLEKKCQKEC